MGRVWMGLGSGLEFYQSYINRTSNLLLVSCKKRRKKMDFSTADEIFIYL